MNYELRELSFSEIIGKSFNLFSNNFVTLFLICFITQLPATGLSIWIFTSGVIDFADITSRDSMIVLFVNIIVAGIFQLIATGVIIRFIANKYLGRHVDLMKLIRSSVGYVGSLFALSIILIVLQAVGFMIFVFPGFIIAIGVSCAVPILVIEKSAVFTAVTRSWELTRGYKLIMGGILAVMYGIVIGISFSTQGIFEAFAKAVSPDNHLLIESVISSIISDAVSPIISCAIVLIYFNLRIQKEGFDVEHLAQRFSENGIE